MQNNHSHNHKPYVVVIGGANMDIYGSSNVILRMKDSNPGTITTNPGGVGRNIAENIAKLDIDCRLITTIGNDLYGKQIIEQGINVGINMKHVLTLKNERTSTYLNILDNENDMLVAISDMAIMDQLNPEHLRLHEQMIKQAELIIVDCNLSEENFAYIADTFTDQPIMVDTVSATKAIRIRPYFHRVHTLKTNRLEAEALCCLESSNNDDLPHMANWLHERDVKRVFITLGSEGVFYSDGNDQDIITSNANNIINASGAGDAFVAGIAYAWLNQYSLIETLQFSMSAAHVALSHRSTINPEMSVKAINNIKEKEYNG